MEWGQHFQPPELSLLVTDWSRVDYPWRPFVAVELDFLIAPVIARHQPKVNHFRVNSFETLTTHANPLKSVINEKRPGVTSRILARPNVTPATRKSASSSQNAKPPGGCLPARAPTPTPTLAPAPARPPSR